MDDPRAAQLPYSGHGAPDGTSVQVLLAEYAMLQASLKLSWDLTQQRTGMFFTVLSATAVAVGLVAQAPGAGTALVPFTVVALAIALFVGLSTFLRVIQALQEVTIIILGMNRIRRFMRDAAPRYAKLFTLPINDDEASLDRGIGGMHGHGAEGMRRGYGILQVPGAIAAVNATLAAVATAIAVAGLATQTTAIVVGVLVFAAVLTVSLWYWQRAAHEVRCSLDPVFPSDIPSKPSAEPH
jgi:hypothetical protein